MCHISRFAQIGLNHLVSGRVGIVRHIFCVCKAESRSSRNRIHLYLVRWQEHGGLVRCTSPTRLRDGRKVHGTVGVIEPPTRHREHWRLQRKLGQIR